MDLFEQLPNEILLHLFTQCGIKEVELCSLVCKRFYTLTNSTNTAFWRTMCYNWWQQQDAKPLFDLDYILSEINAFNKTKGWRWLASCLVDVPSFLYFFVINSLP
jgi:hypothetical protein